MATKEEILDAIASMTVLELSELLKEFEEKFGVTAAAPAAAVAAAPAGGGAGARRRGGEGRVRRRPHRRRRQEDQRHQGGALPHQPRPQGGQGPGGQRTQAGAREGLQGRRREGQGRSSKRPAPASSSSSTGGPPMRARHRPLPLAAQTLDQSAPGGLTLSANLQPVPAFGPGSVIGCMLPTGVARGRVGPLAWLCAVPLSAPRCRPSTSAATAPGHGCPRVTSVPEESSLSSRSTIRDRYSFANLDEASSSPI